MGFIFKRT